MDEEESFDRPNSRNCMRKLCNVLIDILLSQFGLFVVVVLYVILGGFLFEYLESDEGNVKRSSIVKSRDECLKELWAITERLNVLYEKNWTRLVHAQLRKFESSVVALATTEGSEAIEVIDNHWSFTSSLLYSLALVTTIGYGSIAPRTVAGRAATIVYAAAGVPLALACLAALGTSLAKAARAGWSQATGKRHSQAWRMDNAVGNHIQMHEHRQLLGNQSPDGLRNQQQYTALAPGRGRLAHVYQRPGKAATLARVKYAMDYDDLPQTSSPQTQTLDRKQMRGSHLQNNVRGKSRFQPRPMTPEVRQLIVEECGEDAIRERTDEETADSDDLEDERICQHETPSRVPLICKSPLENRKLNSRANHQQHIDTSSSCRNNNSSVDHCHVPISLIVILLSGYICGGAALFSAWEGRGFFDSLYFCFITLSTIGFGDMLPTSLVTSRNFEYSKSEYIQLLACCTYLFLGLLLIAMSLSLIQDELVAKCNQWTNNWGWTKT